MPGSTLHLMFARLLDENAPLEYFAGSILLDAVDDYHLKDKTHFRKLPDRFNRICRYVSSLEDTPFNRGIATHLYLDWRWDACELSRFINEWGDDWFVPYRADISRISHHFSNSLPWCHDLWQSIHDMPVEQYGSIPLATTEECKHFVDFGYKSQKEIKDYPEFFYPDEVELFLKMAALEFPRFMKKASECK